MIKINDPKLLEKYISRYEIDNIFNMNMKPFMELFYFDKNEHICKEGELLSYLFFFVEGKIKIYITLSNGKSLLLSFYDRFRILGDIELMNFKPASTNVQAVKNSYCIGIKIDDARKYLLNDAKFLRFMCNSLVEKLNVCSNNSSINLLYPLENRLASYIVAAAEKESIDGRTFIKFNESLTEISELLGTSYRHLLRTFNILTKKGVIIKNNDKYEILDYNILMKLAADLYK